MENNINLDLKETEYENVDWNSLAHYRVRLPILLHMVIKLRFTQKYGIFLPGKVMLFHQKGSVDDNTHNATFCLLQVAAPR